MAVSVAFQIVTAAVVARVAAEIRPHAALAYQTINKFKTLSVPLSQQMVRESLASVPNEQHQAPARVIGHPVNSQLTTSCSALPERSSSFNSSVNLSIDMGGLCEHLRRAGTAEGRGTSMALLGRQDRAVDGPGTSSSSAYSKEMECNII